MPRPLFILFCTLLLDTITVGILIPIIPLIFSDPTSPSFLLSDYGEQWRPIFVGAIGGLFGFMQFIAAPILGELSDIYGRKKLLALCVGLLAVANMLFGLGIATAFLSVLLVSRLFAGLAGANFSIAQASIADVTAPKDRAKNFGLIGAAFGIGFVVGPLLGGFLSSMTGSAAAPFWFAGALGVFNTLFLLKMLPETKSVRSTAIATFSFTKGIRNIVHAARDPEASPVYLVSFLFGCGFTCFTTYVGVLLSVKYHFGGAAIGTFFALVGICIAVTQIFILRILTTRFSERRILTVGFPVLATCILLYPYAGTAVWIYALIPLTAIPQGLAFANIGALISKSVSREEQGAALGINGSLMALSGGLMPLIAGGAASLWGDSLPFFLGSGFMFAAWFVVLRLNPVVYRKDKVMEGIAPLH